MQERYPASIFNNFSYQCLLQHLISIMLFPSSYEIMLSCWQEEPCKRPNFSHLKQTFSEMLLSQRAGNEYVFLQDTFAAEEQSGTNVPELNGPDPSHFSQKNDKPGRPWSMAILPTSSVSSLLIKATDLTSRGSVKSLYQERSLESAPIPAATLSGDNLPADFAA